MYAWEVSGIIIVALVVAGGFVFNWINSPGGPLARKRNEEMRTLEVRSKLDAGEDLVLDLQKLSRLYLRAGKKWEAEQSLRRALIIAKQEWGDHSPLVINLLEECAKLMTAMRRTSEAANFKKELEKARKFS